MDRNAPPPEEAKPKPLIRQDSLRNQNAAAPAVVSASSAGAVCAPVVSKPGLGLVRAVFDLPAQSPDDLVAARDEWCIVTRIEDQNWYYGISIKSGKSGLFPKQYVTRLSKPNEAVDSDAGDGKDEKVCLLATANWDFATKNPHELTFKRDDWLLVTVRNVAVGWWKGCVIPRERCVPDAKSGAVKSAVEVATVLSDVPKLFFPGSYVTPEGSPDGFDMIRGTCVAAWDLTGGEDPAELSFKAGAKLVITAACTGSEWYVGYDTGSTRTGVGIFPSNYVKNLKITAQLKYQPTGAAVAKATATAAAPSTAAAPAANGSAAKISKK